MKFFPIFVNNVCMPQMKIAQATRHGRTRIQIPLPLLHTEPGLGVSNLSHHSDTDPSCRVRTVLHTLQLLNKTHMLAKRLDTALHKLTGLPRGHEPKEHKIKKLSLLSNSDI